MLDLDLPDSFGLEGLERIIKQRPAIPIIVLTGNNDENLGMQAIQNKASEYLVKGKIDAALLIRSIRYAIERKRAEQERERLLEEVRLSEQRLSWALQAGQGGAWDWNLLTGAAWWSSEMYDLWGIKFGTPMHTEETLAAIDIRDSEYVRSAIAGCIGNHTALNYEFRIQHPTRGERWMATFGRAIYDSADRVIRIHGITLDITGRKKAEEILKRDKEELEKLVRDKTSELLASQKEIERGKRLSDIGTLAATIAHELRNPLAAIKMSAYNIKRKTENPGLEKHFVVINKKIDESDQIINNLLFYSRLKTPQCEQINIHDILDESIEVAMMRHTGNPPKVEKQYKILENVLINADPLQLKELFSNILNNSFDAVSNEKALIKINGKLEADNYLKIAIKDNGHGIEKENLIKVFEHFFTTKAKGTGLGLAVCKQIAELHNGSIAIESELNKGTSVTVRLPL